MKLLGAGSYNECLLSSEGHVLRISKQCDDEDVVRGATITHYFQRHSNLLGPSLVKEVSKGRVRKDGSYVQGLEHLEGGHTPVRPCDPEALALPLVWFLCAARSHFGFAHADFKLENIVFRNYDEEREFLFQLHEHGIYRISATQIPVVIDFDYASIAETIDKSAVGTQYTQPPEILLSRFLGEFENSEQHPKVGAHDDWWSLGIVLYKWWTVSSKLPGLFEAYRESIRQYYLLTDDELKGDWGDLALKHMFRAYCIVKQLGEDVPVTHSVCFGGPRRSFLDMGATHYNRDNPISLCNFQIKLLKRLLSWNPKRRHYNGNPWKLVTEHFEPACAIPQRPPDCAANTQREPFSLPKDIPLDDIL
jgi:serine/threonine protein kinase